MELLQYTANGVAYNTRRIPSGTTDDPSACLLMAHCGSGNKGYWSVIVDELEARLDPTSTALQVIAVDMSNHGQSRPYPKPYGERIICPRDTEDVFPLDLLDALDTEKARLGLEASLPVIGVGHSFGGAQITRAATMRPGEFTAMLLFEPILSFVSDYVELGETFPEVMKSLVAAMLKRKANFPSLEEGIEALRGKMPQKIFPPKMQQVYLEGTLVPAWTRKDLCSTESGEDEVVMSCDPRFEAALYGGVTGNVAYTELVGEIEADVVIACGELPSIPACHRYAELSLGDGVPGFPLPKFYEALSQRFGNGRFAGVLEGAGHFGPQEKPAEFSQMLADLVNLHLPKYAPAPQVDATPAAPAGLWSNLHNVVPQEPPLQAMAVAGKETKKRSRL